jgi:hypothetical protein
MENYHIHKNHVSPLMYCSFVTHSILKYLKQIGLCLDCMNLTNNFIDVSRVYDYGVCV